MNRTATPDLRTAEGIARAVRARRVRRYDAIITEVWIGETPHTADTFPRAKASDIRYRFAIIGDRATIDQPTPLVPASRKLLSKIRIVGAKVGDPCTVILWNNTIRLHVDEELDPYACNQTPVES